MYDDSTATRNYLGGLAREAGLPEPAIPRFIDTVRVFNLNAERFVQALTAYGLTDADLFGISRIEQGKRHPDRTADPQSDPSGYHGRTAAWSLRLFTRDPERKVSETFSDGARGAEFALATAMKSRDAYTGGTHTPRGPYHRKRRRPARDPLL